MDKLKSDIKQKNYIIYGKYDVAEKEFFNKEKSVFSKF